MAWGEAEKDPCLWDSATYIGDLDKGPVCWFQSEPALAVADIWEVNRKMEDSESLSL